MKTNTFIKRVAEVAFTKKGEFSCRYTSALSSIQRLQKGQKVYPFSWSRNNKHYQLIDKEDKIREILDASKISYERGNDAPKGGVTGCYIILTKKGICQMKDVNLDEVFNHKLVQK